MTHYDEDITSNGPISLLAKTVPENWKREKKKAERTLYIPAFRILRFKFVLECSPFRLGRSVRKIDEYLQPLHADRKLDGFNLK